MKFAALVFWWHHRRSLKARGYSLKAFCRVADSFWNSLAEDTPAHGFTDGFSRRELRTRW